jgi:hypothetical protein
VAELGVGRLLRSLHVGRQRRPGGLPQAVQQQGHQDLADVPDAGTDHEPRVGHPPLHVDIGAEHEGVTRAGQGDLKAQSAQREVDLEEGSVPAPQQLAGRRLLVPREDDQPAAPVHEHPGHPRTDRCPAVEEVEPAEVVLADDRRVVRRVDRADLRLGARLPLLAPLPVAIRRLLLLLLGLGVVLGLGHAIELPTRLERMAPRNRLATST